MRVLAFLVSLLISTSAYAQQQLTLHAHKSSYADFAEMLVSLGGNATLATSLTRHHTHPNEFEAYRLNRAHVMGIFERGNDQIDFVRSGQREYSIAFNAIASLEVYDFGKDMFRLCMPVGHKIGYSDRTRMLDDGDIRLKYPGDIVRSSECKNDDIATIEPPNRRSRNYMDDDMVLEIVMPNISVAERFLLSSNNRRINLRVFCYPTSDGIKEDDGAPYIECDAQTIWLLTVPRQRGGEPQELISYQFDRRSESWEVEFHF